MFKLIRDNIINQYLITLWSIITFMGIMFYDVSETLYDIHKNKGKVKYVKFNEYIPNIESICITDRYKVCSSFSDLKLVKINISENFYGTGRNIPNIINIEVIK